MSTKQNELQPFEFSNGIVVMTKQVSVMLTMDIHKQFPAPRPPRQQVTLPGGETQWEENMSDPDYQIALESYKIEQEERIRRLLIKRGVVVEMTDAIRQQVKELREFWKSEYDKDLPGDDLMVYVTYICIGPQADQENLINKILRQSQPTQEAIEESQASFPGKV